MPNYASVPRSDSGGPSIEPAVLRRLRALSPGPGKSDSTLRLVWRNMRWNPFDPDNPLIAERGQYAGKAIPWPGGGGRWILFNAVPGRRVEFLFVLQTAEGAYHPADHRLVDNLVSDLARRMDPGQIAEFMQQLDEQSRARLKRKLVDLNEQKMLQNKTKVREAMENVGTSAETSRGPLTREPATIIYPGMDSRKSAAEREQIPLTAEEEGWELPDVKKELHG